MIMKRANFTLALVLGAMLIMPAMWAQKPPQPKSPKEVEALQAIQKAQGADAQLKAIDNVLENFADTEYKVMLLQMAMQISEQKGDYAGTTTYAERTLEADPKNIFALATLAIEISGHTREFDLDKEEKLAKAEKYAKEAITYSKDAPKVRPDLPDEQWNNVKRDIVSQAHDALGRAAVLRTNYPVAITEFKTAIDTGATKDSTTMVRLGDAYMKAGNFDDAIASFDNAASMPDAPAAVKQIATSKKAEAVKAKAAGAKPSAPPQNGQVEIKK